MNYTLIRSRRKSITIQIKADGEVVVRAPQRAVKKVIQDFVDNHEEWIRKTQKMLETNSYLKLLRADVNLPLFC